MTSQQASLKKKMGHAQEAIFMALFGFEKLQAKFKSSNFSGPNEDCIVSSENFKNILKPAFNLPDSYNEFKISLKSGRTWQFHLGKIDEISKNTFYKGFNELEEHRISESHIPCLFNYEFWKKYLGKRDFLVFHENGDYHFFIMKDVINYIINNASWRILKSKRIKADFGDKLSGIITFEERKEKKRQKRRY